MTTSTHWNILDFPRLFIIAPISPKASYGDEKRQLAVHNLEHVSSRIFVAWLAPLMKDLPDRQNILARVQSRADRWRVLDDLQRRGVSLPLHRTGGDAVQWLHILTEQGGSADAR